jgi:hypothetical protein
MKAAPLEPVSAVPPTATGGFRAAFIAVSSGVPPPSFVR